MPDSAPSIVIPAQAVPFRHGMSRFHDRLAVVGAIKIVAIGSSTIAGTHDIVEDLVRSDGRSHRRAPPSSQRLERDAFGLDDGRCHVKGRQRQPTSVAALI